MKYNYRFIATIVRAGFCGTVSFLNKLRNFRVVFVPWMKHDCINTMKEN